MKNTILLHLPHSSIHIPEEIRKDILLSDDELREELLALTDRYTDELFGVEGVVTVKNIVSRLVFDPERFRDDKHESMSRVGRGAVYTMTSSGKRLRVLTPGKREELLQLYYDPYHKRLEEEVSRLLDQHGSCLIIDGHSFTEKALPYEMEKSHGRPDICVGTCDFHTPEELVLYIEKRVIEQGLSVKRNYPFAGTMVPMKYYRKDSRVMSVMLEVNRKLYMNEAEGSKLPEFSQIRAFVQSIVKDLLKSKYNG